MDCPNGCGEMEQTQIYVEVGDYGTTVYVYMCQECQYSDASTYRTKTDAIRALGDE
jgi:hypothetical protein